MTFRDGAREAKQFYKPSDPIAPVLLEIIELLDQDANTENCLQIEQLNLYYKIILI